MENSACISVSNDEKKQYFFAEKHSNYGLGNNWVPATHYCSDQDEVRKVHYSDYTEIVPPEANKWWFNLSYPNRKEFAQKHFVTTPADLDNDQIKSIYNWEVLHKVN